MGFQNKLLLSLICITIALAGLIQSSHGQDSPQDYLNAHNSARAQVGVAPLVWDNGLAAFALQHLNQHIDDCSLEHSRGPYGENIAGSSDDLSGTTAVRLWVDEKDYYDYDSNSCAPGKVCGHYIQVVWRDTVRVGCAKVRCHSGGTLISCNYDPGADTTQRPYYY